MLKKEDMKDGILLIFDPMDEIKNNIFGISVMISLVCVWLYFYLDLTLETTIIGFSFTIAFVSIMQFLFYYRIEIHLKKDKIQIRKKWVKEKELVCLYYRDIKNIDRIHVGGRASFNFLKIRTFFGQEYDILKYTSLEKDLDEIIQTYEEAKKRAPFYEKLKKWEEIYEEAKEERYLYILTHILKEEKVFLVKSEDYFMVNACEEAIHHLDMFKGMEFEEMDFYKFYLDYLSDKDYENTVVRVGDNGRDYKEVTMKQLKEDINKLRDEK